MKKLDIFEDQYNGEEVSCMEIDVAEALYEDTNPVIKKIPRTEEMFFDGVFTVKITWEAFE